MALSGHLHPRAKLNDDIVSDIIWRYADGGNTYMSLAEEYGVDVGTISAILRGKTWRHITGGVPVKAPSRPLATHCRKGHELTDANIVITERSDRPNPRRECRRCKNAYQAKFRRNKRGNP